LVDPAFVEEGQKMLLWRPVQSINDDLGQAAKQLDHALPGAILLSLPLNGIVQVLLNLLPQL
jgi:hypothetical protein